jgi:AbrB family looped-hinge helix DNA binding protein
MEKTSMIELTKTSSKGQVVIPTDIRKRLRIKSGTILLITTKNQMVVMKKMNAKISKEDLKTLKGVEEAWRDIEEGKYKVYSKAAFSKELAKW